jgi:GNAT superfamily N-acetyltransferase
MDYSVTQQSDVLHDEVVRLHAQLINGGLRMSRAYLRWKYLDNPLLQPPIMIVVRYGKRIVGMRGIVGTHWRFSDAGEPLLLGHADDLIIDPEHRNRGLFLRINEAMVDVARNRGFDHLISLSSGEGTQKLSLLCGWKALGELERMYRDPARSGDQSRRAAQTRDGGWRIYRAIRGRLGYDRVRPPSDRAVKRSLRRTVTSTSPRTEISAEADLESMSSLASAVYSGRSRPSRDEAFLEWRLRNPQRKYRYVYWRDSRLRGYLILAWTRRDAKTVLVADHAAESEPVFLELLDACTRSRHGALSLISSTLSASELRAAEAAGFTRDPDYEKDQMRQFLFYPLAGSAELLLPGAKSATFPEEWHVDLLDTMAS